jgi:hypothetical protein
MSWIDDMEKSLPPKAAERVTSVRRFTCPSCGGEIQIRAGGHTLAAVCAHCGSVIDVGDARLKIIQETAAKTKETFLSIGQRGELQGVVWEVIGYVQKSDRTKVYYWDEYLLFNPWHGFRFLVQMDGHWNFVKIIKSHFPKTGFNTQVWHGDDCYKPFLQDDPIVQYVKGEFYWRIKKGEQAKTEDYVCPPYMLSFEYTGSDKTVSLCEYTEPEVIRAAFGIARPMPYRKGVGPNQPAPMNTRRLWRTFAAALVAAIFIQMALVGASKNEKLVAYSQMHGPLDRTRTFMSESFSIPKQSNVLITAYAPVDNAWVEIDLSLVNDATKEDFDALIPIEYYHGYDSDGSWTEGSQMTSEYLSAVSRGDYRMVYEIDADAFTRQQQQPVQITVTRDVASWGNFWWTFFLLLAYPAYAAMKAGSFEVKRWENSDFPRTS